MTSVVDLEIRVPRARLAELFANPRNNVRWMDDLQGVEALSGTIGAPGSRYRLVPRTGGWEFVATVVAKDLPDEVRLRLEGPGVTVTVIDQFVVLSPEVTRLHSVEDFQFHGPIKKGLGFLSRGRIRRAHRRHMDAFKRFAEGTNA